MKKKPLAKKAPKKTANDWLAAMMQEHIIGGRPEIVPEGWLTLAQICAKTGISQTTIRTRLIKLIEAGKMECRLFRIFTGKQTIPVKHYMGK
jgi:DNA-binding GntR family transcriptional regulator